MFYKVILNYVKFASNFSILLYEDLLSLLDEGNTAKKLLKNGLDFELSMLKNLKFSLNNSSAGETPKKLINFGFETLKKFPKNYENEYLKLKIKNNRAIIKEIIKKINELFFFPHLTTPPK